MHDADELRARTAQLRRRLALNPGHPFAALWERNLELLEAQLREEHDR